MAASAAGAGASALAAASELSRRVPHAHGALTPIRAASTAAACGGAALLGPLKNARPSAGPGLFAGSA